jgi:uncharacterized membrane protein YedE/YeeE
MTGIGKKVSFFDWDWKSQRWNLVVVLGAMIGGYVAVHFLSDSSNVAINPETISQLQNLGFDAPNGKLLPDFLFGSEALQSPKMIAILVIGGILIGFGSRYAGGCTSGHAISGLSNFQLPSLKAVIGFFIGGLIMLMLGIIGEYVWRTYDEARKRPLYIIKEKYQMDETAS